MYFSQKLCYFISVIFNRNLRFAHVQQSSKKKKKEERLVEQFDCISLGGDLRRFINTACIIQT